MKIRVAIDVIPIRTDGRVGGLMPATNALIQEFCKRSEEVDILLLTAEWNHAYFTEMVGSERVLQVVGEEASPSSSLLRRAWEKCKRWLAGPPETFRTMKADVMYCPMSAISLFREDLPVICQINDIQHEYYPQFFTPEENSHRTSFYKNVCEKATALVAISQYTKDTFCEKYAFPAERMQVIHLSVQERLLRLTEAQKEAVLEPLGLSGKRYFYYPANFWPHKNHDVLLVAFNMLVKQGSDAHLVLTGSLADARQTLGDAVRQMGLTERVHFLGYVSDEQLAAIFQQCHALVFPSLFEGFGIPLVEAMSFGKPIVCSSSTCLPEVAQEAALYFDPRKPAELCAAMRQLEEKPDLYAALQEKGRLRLAAFNQEKMVNLYMDVFRKWGNKQ